MVVLEVLVVILAALLVIAVIGFSLDDLFSNFDFVGFLLQTIVALATVACVALVAVSCEVVITPRTNDGSEVGAITSNVEPQVVTSTETQPEEEESSAMKRYDFGSSAFE